MAELRVGDQTYEIFRLDELQGRWDIARLPYTLRILLENVLRHGRDEDVEAIAGWISTGSLTACGRGSWLATPTCPLFASAARMPARSCFTCDRFRRRE